MDVSKEQDKPHSEDEDELDEGQKHRNPERHGPADPGEASLPGDDGQGPEGAPSEPIPGSEGDPIYRDQP